MLIKVPINQFNVHYLALLVRRIEILFTVPLFTAFTAKVSHWKTEIINDITIFTREYRENGFAAINPCAAKAYLKGKIRFNRSGFVAMPLGNVCCHEERNVF